MGSQCDPIFLFLQIVDFTYIGGIIEVFAHSRSNEVVSYGVTGERREALFCILHALGGVWVVDVDADLMEGG